jgi:hypothetical protein
MEVHLPPQVAWRANKKDSFAQQRQAARAAGGRWSWSLERVRRMIDAGDDLGGTVDLGRLGALTASVDPAVMRRSRDLRGQVPAIGVGLIADLHAFCEHNGIAT